MQTKQFPTVEKVCIHLLMIIQEIGQEGISFREQGEIREILE